ncbi:unnamed protein product [Mytilus edulis]|uniref:Uncharacterized protein n=1 Tax=Mytilus edulis TaxID=6550 RepID=A0A8S3Q4M4_MYTED|nr:unnamed protein product [Mytilus edulis]
MCAYVSHPKPSACIKLHKSEQTILTDSIIEVYTTEGSTMNIIHKNNRIGKFLGKRNNNSILEFDRVNTTKYDIVVHPSVLELQIVNVTANISCPFSSTHDVCAIAGSSPMVNHTIKVSVYHSTIDLRQYVPDNARIVSNITIHAVLQMYNVTHEDQDLYHFILVFLWRNDEAAISK